MNKKNCYVCKQSWPSCCQTLLELWGHGHHDKFVHPNKGLLKEAWGLGIVWVTCCSAIYNTWENPPVHTVDSGKLYMLPLNYYDNLKSKL